MGRTGPANLHVVVFALAMGGAMIALMPLLLFYLDITVMEIVPGFDLVWVLFPAVAIVDWIMAYYFWRKANPSASRDGPVVD